MLNSLSTSADDGRVVFYENFSDSTVSCQHFQFSVSVTQVVDIFLVGSIDCCVSWWYSGTDELEKTELLGRLEIFRSCVRQQRSVSEARSRHCRAE